MTKRQIPIGDPRIKGMNDTQWVFELESMNKEDSERYRDIELMGEMVTEKFASMLGLNLCPVEDEKTGLLRMPEADEIMPLAVMIGRDDVLSMIKERHDHLKNQEEVARQLSASGQYDGQSRFADTGVVEMSPEELEAFMEDAGDVECDTTAEELKRMMAWGGRNNQVFLEHLVLNKDDIEEGSLDDFAARTIGQTRNDLRKHRSVPRHTVEEIDLSSIRITSDRESRHEEPSPDRPVVVIESD